MKLLCGLNPQDRQSRQEGPFGLEYVVLRQSVFDKVERSKAQFREKLSIELIKKLRGDEELSEAALRQQVQAEVEQRTREKFIPRVGVWTPVDKNRLPKIQGVDHINVNNALETLKRPATMVSQRIPTGERVLIQFETLSAHLKTLADLGMRDKMQEQFTELLNRPKGLVLFSALPAGGMRTTLDVVLRGMDRFLREFVAVEDEANRYTAVENVPVTTYKASAGESPASILVKLFRKEPNVVVVRDLVDGQTVSVLCRETVQNDRVMIGSIRAKDAAEAMVRTLMLKVPPEEFAAALLGVLYQRLVRKLCETCKEPYAPAPEVLQQLGIPPGAFLRLLPSPSTEAGRGERGTLPRVQRRRLQGANRRVRTRRRRRPDAQDPRRLAEARSAPPGRPKGRHEEPARGRRPPRRPRRHLPAGIDAGAETISAVLPAEKK